jgi:hypothetical protein
MPSSGRPEHSKEFEASNGVNDKHDGAKALFNNARALKVKRTDAATPAPVDENVSNLRFPPLQTRYSFLTILFYRILSCILSLNFLLVIMFCALVKAVALGLWSLFSGYPLRDPAQSRPFYELERERKKLDMGGLMRDVGYFAERGGLCCQEFKVETEDGFILTVQHVLDCSPGSVHYKRMALSQAC